MSEDGEKAAVMRTTRVRTKLKGDSSWLQQCNEPQSETSEGKVRTKLKGDSSWLQRRDELETESTVEKPWIAELRNCRVNGDKEETSSVLSPTKSAAPLATVRGVFAKLDTPAPSSPTNSFSGASKVIKKPSESYKKIAPHTVRATSDDQETQLTKEEQEKRTEAASSVLRKSAARQQSYVLSAAKKFESQQDSKKLTDQSNPSFVAKRVEITDDDDDEESAMISAPVPSLPQPKPRMNTTIKATVDEPVAPKEETTLEPGKEDSPLVSVTEKDPFECMKPGCTKVATPLPELMSEYVQAVRAEAGTEDSSVSGKTDTLLVELNPEVSPVPESPVPVSFTPELPGPAEVVPESPVPVSFTPEPPAPAEVVPESPVPVSFTPESPAPAEVVPESPVPVSFTPESPALAEVIPESPVPVSFTPESPAPAEVVPEFPVPVSFTPESPAPAEVVPESPVPVSITPESPAPAEVVPEFPVPVSITPEAPATAVVEPKSPAQVSTTLESPAPPEIVPEPAALSTTPESPVPDSPTPVTFAPVSPAQVSAVTEITMKTELEPSPNPSSSDDTLTALSDTLISFNTSSSSLKDDEPALTEEQAPSAGSRTQDKGAEDQPTPELSNCVPVTDDLLFLTDGPEAPIEPVPQSPGRWSLDLLDRESRKPKNTLDLLVNDVIVFSKEAPSLSMQPEEEKQTVKGTQSSTETVTITTKTVIITDKGEEHSTDPSSPRVTTTVTESSLADPFDPYPIGTTSPNSSADLLQPHSDISINSVSPPYAKKNEPSPKTNMSSGALESLADDIIPIDTDTSRLSTQRSWTHTWETSTTKQADTGKSQDAEPEDGDQKTFVMFERKSTENDSPWDRWTSPTIYTITTTKEDEEEESPEDMQRQTVTTVTTIREIQSEPHPAVDHYETYSRTLIEEDQRVQTPPPEVKKPFVYVKEYVNTTALALHNISEPYYSYSSPTSYYSGSLSSTCTYCGELVGNDSKISIEHLNINSHPDCFKCAVCGKPMGDLLHSLFIHGGKVNCESCYSKAFD